MTCANPLAHVGAHAAQVNEGRTTCAREGYTPLQGYTLPSLAHVIQHLPDVRHADARRTEAMSWYAVIWCPDCTGQDDLGCFDGGTEEHGPFATREEAEAAGQENLRSIYRYDIEERHDAVTPQR